MYHPASQNTNVQPTRRSRVIRIVGHQCPAVEVGRENKLVALYPANDCPGLGLNRVRVRHEVVREVSVQIVAVAVGSGIEEDDRYGFR